MVCSSPCRFPGLAAAANTSCTGWVKSKPTLYWVTGHPQRRLPPPPGLLAHPASPAARPRRDARVYSHTRYPLVSTIPPMIEYVAFFPRATVAAIAPVSSENTTACVTYSRSARARRSSAPNDSAVHGELLSVPYACMVSLIAARNSRAAAASADMPPLDSTPAIRSPRLPDERHIQPMRQRCFPVMGGD